MKQLVHTARWSKRWVSARVIGVAGVLAATAPIILVAQEQHEETGGIFSLNLGLVVWTWVLFLLTLGILAWKVFPVISGGLEDRHAKIQGAIDEARTAREEAAALLEKQRAALEEARSESKDILEKARNAADGLKKEILEDAKTQQTALLDDARREINLEREKLREDIREEAVDIALAASERLIRARLDVDENRRLVNDFMSEF